MKKISCRFLSTVNTDFIDSTGFMAEGEIVDATKYMNFEFYLELSAILLHSLTIL